MLLGSTALDVAIGLVFIYLVISLICSSLNEGVEAFFKNRSKDLEKGIREILTSTSSAPASTPAASNAKPPADPPQTPADAKPLDLVQAIYDHPLISSLFRGTYQTAKKSGELPSYIPAPNFAHALIDIIRTKTAGNTAALESPAANPAVVVAQLRQAAVDFQQFSPRVSNALIALIDAAGNDINKVRQNIEHWFDSSMDRVSGWYKRRAQFFIFGFGLAIAAFANIDSIGIVKVLSSQAGVRDALVAQAGSLVAKQTPAGAQQQSSSPSTQEPAPNSSTTADLKQTAADLNKTVDQLRNLGLPVGWDNPNYRPAPTSKWYESVYPWALKVLGIILTSLAVSLGAPFWFDLLNRFIVVRSTVKPMEKSQPEKSKE